MMWKISSKREELERLTALLKKDQAARGKIEEETKEKHHELLKEQRASVQDDEADEQTIEEELHEGWKNISDEERWRNFWYESEWSTFYLSNEEDEELKQFAEDDQGDMSAAPGLRPKQRQVDCALFLFESEGDEFDYC